MKKKNDDTVQKKFNEIYAVEADIIFRFCLIRVSNKEQALDVSQEVFVRFWQALVSKKTMTNHRAFLFTIAHHLIIDWYRKKKSVSLEALTSGDEAEVFEPSDGVTDVDRSLGIEGRYVMDKIKELDSSYREVVSLRFIEGLPPAEIGQILGISTNAASVRINRGIEKLRILTGYDIDEGYMK
jgi:RNA polymerase sigma-70 factor (ECF subfamily)